MGQSQGIVCFNFNVPGMYIQDSCSVCFHFMEFGEKFAVAIAHYSIFAQDFLSVTSVALILNQSREQLEWHSTLATWLICIFMGLGLGVSK